MESTNSNIDTHQPDSVLTPEEDHKENESIEAAETTVTNGDRQDK
jgi:hypothetical protein